MRQNKALLELSQMLTENMRVKKTQSPRKRMLLEYYLSEDDFNPEMAGMPAQGAQGGQQVPQQGQPQQGQGNVQMTPEQMQMMMQMPMDDGGMTEEELDQDFPLDGHFGGEGDQMAQAQGILPIKNEIDEIRQIALRTIAKLAENPTSDCYKFLKKIFLDCDRALESALEPEDGKKKKGV